MQNLCWKRLSGPVAPGTWHGGLPFAYHIGPGKTTVHLKVAFDWDIVPCYDVIAKIQGAKYPDEWVIRGNHQDAWVNGADDPISGQACNAGGSQINRRSFKSWLETRSYFSLLCLGW